jgi:uncharacterized protein YndB with AHSA1/START domain
MKSAILVALGVLAMAPGAFGDVADASANGFTVKITMQLQAAPADVYRKITGNVGDWWNSQHTFSGSSRNLTLDAKAQGCFCEKLGDSGSARHMEVVTAVPGQRLVLTGALGPLQSMAVVGNLTFQFAPADGGGTKLEITYAVGGYAAGGLTNWAKIVDGVLTEQFTRLKNFVEKGTAEPK